MISFLRDLSLGTWNSRLLRIHASYIDTLAIQCTHLAIWPLSMTDLSSVRDEVHMEWIDPLCRQNVRKELMRFLGRNFCSDQAEPLAGAVNVRIDWHGWPVEIEHEHA